MRRRVGPQAVWRLHRMEWDIRRIFPDRRSLARPPIVLEPELCWTWRMRHAWSAHANPGLLAPCWLADNLWPDAGRPDPDATRSTSRRRAEPARSAGRLDARSEAQLQCRQRLHLHAGEPGA